MGFCQSCLLPWNANQGSVQLEPNAPRHGSEMAIHNIERLPALPRMKSSIHLSLRSTTTWILLVPAYIHGFLNFSRISNDRPPSNNMRAVHISTCPSNASNKWQNYKRNIIWWMSLFAHEQWGEATWISLPVQFMQVSFLQLKVPRQISFGEVALICWSLSLGHLGYETSQKSKYQYRDHLGY